MSDFKRKGKEIMVEDVSALEDGEGCLDMINEDVIDGNYKGKGLLDVSNGSGYDDDDDKRVSYIDEDDVCFYNDEDDLEYLPDKHLRNMDDISYIQAQFEKSDIPTGIEVDIRWLSEPAAKNGKPFDLSSPSSSCSPQFMLGSGLDQTAHSNDTKPVGNSICSSSHKSRPLSNNNEVESIVTDPTECPGKSSENPSVKYLKEAAMTRLNKFENFAVVEDYSDHHYVKMLRDTKLEKAASKKIQDEWRILQSSLPDTIFVRVYESQMALLRAVIIGPQGTPYHDGLFFFDVMMPSNYPNSPPEVHYYCGGLSLNPNLYIDGKVCLSLLGTWYGENATENWIPGKSTLLQVLVSIQALILNEKPFFNEPYKSRYNDNYGRRESELYNEETLIKSLKNMIYSMKRPPKYFENFVRDFFITRSRNILLVCKEYKNGARVGSVSIVDGKPVREIGNCTSSKFEGKLGYIMNSLIDEFTKLGLSDCEIFRVPASGLTWEEIPKPDSFLGSNFGSLYGNYELKENSNHYLSALLPAAPGDAYQFPQPPPMPVIKPPLPTLYRPPTVAAMSSWYGGWYPSFPVHAGPPSWFGQPQLHMQNVPPQLLMQNVPPQHHMQNVPPQHHMQNVQPVLRLNPHRPTMSTVPSMPNVPTTSNVPTTANVPPTPNVPAMPNVFRTSGRPSHSRRRGRKSYDDKLKGTVHKWSDV